MTYDGENSRLRKKSQSKSKLSSKKKKKKRKFKKNFLIIFSFIILSFLTFIGFYTFKLLGNVKHGTISKTPGSLGISSSTLEELKKYPTYDDVTNIALFGLDQRNNNETSRSDAVMILSIDKAHKKIKLTSVMRDSYVQIDGHKKDKLTHAYAYGGPELSIKTLNKNFNLNIKDYVSVNFFNMEKIIDSLGGIEVEVKSSEIKEINKYMKEISDITNTPFTSLTNSGRQLLNGRQALSYARIRSVGNGDFERTSRQRKVLEALFTQIKDDGVLKFPYNVSKLAPMIETSFSSSDMLKTGLSLFLSRTVNLETARIPVDGTFKDGGQMIQGVWYLPFDENKNINALQKYIYEDKKLNNQ